MFKIDSTQSIKLSRGDDIHFPIFLNKGTERTPIRYVVKKTTSPVDEVIFILMFPNETEEKFVLRKTFKIDLASSTATETKGKVKTELYDFEDKEVVTSEKTVNNIVNNNGDMILSLESTDTKDLPLGKYYYRVKAKILNPDGERVENTVTNKFPFYLLDE